MFSAWPMRIGGFPSISLSQDFKRGERIGKPLATEHRARVTNIEVQMRLGGISAVAKQPKDLAAAHLVADLYTQRSRLHVRVESVLPVADVHNYVVAAYRLQRDWNGARCFTRYILRNAVLRLRDYPVGHSEDFVPVGAVILIVRRITFVRLAVGIKLHPINRAALRDISAAVNWNERAAVSRRIRGAVSRLPIGTAQGRADYRHWVFIHLDRRSVNCESLRIIADLHRDSLPDRAWDIIQIVKVRPHVHYRESTRPNF